MLLFEKDKNICKKRLTKPSLSDKIHHVPNGTYALVAQLDRAFILLSEENKKSEPFSYREKVRIFIVWCDGRDSNPRPTDS